MTTAIPFWRRLDTDSFAARSLGLVVLAGVLGLIWLLVAVPLTTRLDDAARRAATLDKRAAALSAAAAERLVEAEIAVPPAAALAEAGAYLNEFAPLRDPEAAMLDLLSTLRLIAQASKVRLTSATPLDLNRNRSGLMDLGAQSVLQNLAAEARIVTDHAGLVRFLEAVEKASPALRAASLDVTAKTARADQEEDRLTIRVVVGALIRDNRK